MENSPVSLEMGVIVCKHCETEIGTFDSEKVTTYYSDCQEPQCLANRIHSDKEKALPYSK